MKLKELSDAIASTCDVRGNVVNAVQTETFRQIRAQLDKGEKVIIPEFGMFLVKEVPGEDGTPAKKTVRFRERAAEGKNKNKNKEDRKAKKAGGAAPTTEDDD